MTPLETLACVSLQHPEVSCGALMQGLNPYRVLPKEMLESEVFGAGNSICVMRPPVLFGIRA